MHNFLVVDNEWNQENYPDLIDLVFAVPPSYARVTQTNRPADYADIWDMRAAA